MSLSFEDANLLDKPKVREAFDFVVRRMEKKLEPLVTQSFVRQLSEAEYSINHSPELTDAQKKAELENVEHSRQAVLAPNSPHFARAMEENMKATAQQPAYKQSFDIGRILSTLKKEGTEDMVAAALLYSSTVTPMDFKDVEKQFGADVCALVSEMKQARVYRDECDFENLSEKAQIMSLMEDVYSFRAVMDLVDSLQPGQKVKLYPVEYVENAMSRQSLLGRDAEVDEIYEEAFNAVNARVDTGISMRIENGEMKLQTPDKVASFALAGPDADGSGPKPKDPKGPGPKPSGPKRDKDGDIKLF